MIAILNDLNADLQAKNGEQERQLRGAQDRIELLELAQQEQEFKVASAEYQAQSAREQSMSATKQAQQLQQELAAFRSLARLPQSLQECADFFLRAFPSKIVFSDRGRRSMQQADYADVPGFWAALWAMASELYPLFFETNGNAGDIEQRFKELTGIDMAMTEGSLTKATSDS